MKKKIKTKIVKKIKSISRKSNKKKMFQIRDHFLKKLIEIHRKKENQIIKKTFQQQMQNRKMFLKYN